MIIWIYTCLIVALISSNIECQQKIFDVKIKNDGSYNLLIKNQTWLESANTFMRANNAKYDTYSKSLMLKGIQNSQGTDKLGNWKAVTFIYTLNNDTSITMNCNILIYDNLHLVRFIQVTS